MESALAAETPSSETVGYTASWSSDVGHSIYIVDSGDINSQTSSATLDRRIDSASRVLSAFAMGVAVDQVLGAMSDETANDLVIGDLAFEQVSAQGRRPRGGVG